MEHFHSSTHFGTWAKTDLNFSGPCHFVNGSTEPSLNEYSWNTVSNMLYVDQPIGTW